MVATKYKDKDGKVIFISDFVDVDTGDGPIMTQCKNVGGAITLEDRAGGHWTRQLYHYPERLKKVNNV